MVRSYFFQAALSNREYFLFSNVNFIFSVLVKNLPEDVKYAVIDCLSALHECLTPEVIREIYNCAQKFHLLHAQTVYICTQMARNESYINLR